MPVVKDAAEIWRDLEPPDPWEPVKGDIRSHQEILETYGKFHADWWGARGDGVTDCAEAFALLTDWVESQGGGRCYFGPGTYVVGDDTAGSTIYPVSRLHLIGIGDPIIVHRAKTPDGNQRRLFVIGDDTGGDPITDVTLEAFRIDGGQDLRLAIAMLGNIARITLDRIHVFDCVNFSFTFGSNVFDPALSRHEHIRLIDCRCSGFGGAKGTGAGVDIFDRAQNVDVPNSRETEIIRYSWHLVRVPGLVDVVPDTLAAWSSQAYDDNERVANAGRGYIAALTAVGASTVAPTHTSGTVLEADGYAWQALGNLGSATGFRIPLPPAREPATQYAVDDLYVDAARLVYRVTATAGAGLSGPGRGPAFGADPLGSPAVGDPIADGDLTVEYVGLENFLYTWQFLEKGHDYSPLTVPVIITPRTVAPDTEAEFGLLFTGGVAGGGLLELVPINPGTGYKSPIQLLWRDPTFQGRDACGQDSAEVGNHPVQGIKIANVDGLLIDGIDGWGGTLGFTISNGVRRATGGNIHLSFGGRGLTLVGSNALLQAKPFVSETDVDLTTNRIQLRALNPDGSAGAVIVHGFADGQTIQFVSGGGELPVPLTEDATFFVKSPTATDFQVSLTPGGGALDLTTVGDGQHRCGRSIVSEVFGINWHGIVVGKAGVKGSDNEAITLNGSLRGVSLTGIDVEGSIVFRNVDDGDRIRDIDLAGGVRGGGNLRITDKVLSVIPVRSLERIRARLSIYGEKAETSNGGRAFFESPLRGIIDSDLDLTLFDSGSPAVRINGRNNRVRVTCIDGNRNVMDDTAVVADIGTNNAFDITNQLPLPGATTWSAAMVASDGENIVVPRPADWAASVAVAAGDEVTSNRWIYVSETTGTTGTDAPSHFVGTVTDDNGIDWTARATARTRYYNTRLGGTLATLRPVAEAKVVDSNTARLEYRGSQDMSYFLERRAAAGAGPGCTAARFGGVVSAAKANRIEGHSYNTSASPLAGLPAIQGAREVDLGTFALGGAATVTWPLRATEDWIVLAIGFRAVAALGAGTAVALKAGMLNAAGTHDDDYFATQTITASAAAGVEWLHQNTTLGAQQLANVFLLAGQTMTCTSPGGGATGGTVAVTAIVAPRMSP